jgi:uncharacterized damage-inducible protein DinB
VPDQRPPRLAGDERDTLLALLQYQRDSVVRKVDGLRDVAARREIVESGTTLMWLVKHLTTAETLWVLRRFAGEDVALPDDTVTRDDTIAGAVEAYRATWQRVAAVVAAEPSLDAVCRGLDPAEEPANLRWVLAHLLEETARHAGHADIIRELLDGHTGR